MINKTISFAVTFIFIVICATFAGVSSKIHPWVDANTSGGQEAEFFIVLKEKADLSPAFQMSRKIDRGRFVFDTLYQIAQRSQAPLQQLLKSRGIEFRSFYIINAILVKGTRELAEELAARADVDRIEGNPVIHNALPQPGSSFEPETPEVVEWNIDRTNAPDMWALGFTGQGIVVGGGDTGYRWTHNALKSKYRGWDGVTADHDYNWHDSIHSGGGICGADSPEPCDDFFHGTHTMGTALGDDGGTNQIGMAPGAKWIGCRNMDVGVGTPATYMECFEFFLAPYPVGGNPGQGDPALAPDLTTNSWSCPASEGCTIGNELQAAVDAQEAAGIMTVAAAQNSGSSCGTVNDPPAIYASAYAVGSTTMSDALSTFSSRGPADFTGLMKPSIVAPGSSVRSATNTSDSAYTTASGTSMATPNVAGGVALLWSALPTFQNDQVATETLLNDSAKPLPVIVEACGGDYVDGPNNSWGFGLMDVLSAYNCGITPATAPQNLTSMLTVNNDVSLLWDAVTGATSYEIHRGSGVCPGSAFVQIGTSTVASFVDTTVNTNTTYSYKVKALVSFCESGFSNCTDETIPCSYSIVPDNATFTAAGGTGSFDVTTGTGCNWTAVSNDSWIIVTGGGSGSGNGAVDYSVDPNPSSVPRSGTITAADDTFTVDQDGAACVYSMLPTSADYTAAGGNGSFGVTTPDGCAWTPTTGDTWITITSGPGSGNGTVDYSVAVNPDPTPRTGTITVAGQTFTVNQEAAGAPCMFCDDFEDDIPPMNWTFIKGTWTESGGNLIGVPGSKASAIASPAFAGCINCTVQAQMETFGGVGNKVWVLGWYVDKANTMEFLMKQESGKWVLKQRSGKTVVAKQKAISPISVGTVYTVVISFNGTQFDVTLDGNPLFSLTPVAPVSMGTVGFRVKDTTGQFGEIIVN